MRDSIVSVALLSAAMALRVALFALPWVVSIVGMVTIFKWVV